MWDVKHTIEYGEHRITGTVDGCEIIVLSTHETRPSTVLTSTSLPSNIEYAGKIVKCMAAAFKKFDELPKG